MDEYLKINWREIDQTNLESDEFISEKLICDSYIYKSFDKPIEPVKIDINQKCKYVPGREWFTCIKRKSLLKKSEKEECFEALKLFQSGKDLSNLSSTEKHCIDVYNKCQSLIVTENKDFQNFTKMKFYKMAKANKRKSPILKYGENVWKGNCQRYLQYPKYYKQKSLVSLSYCESEGEVQYECTNLALEVGTLARFTEPTLKSRCLLRFTSLPSAYNERLTYSKLPPSQDKNIEKVLDSHQVDVVISSSGLKQIMDNTDPKKQWLIPVIIKECNGRKIVFIDKTLPKTTPNKTDLNYFSVKCMLKTNFCENEAFQYPENDIPLNTDNLQQDITMNTDNFKTKTNVKIHHNVNYRFWKIRKAGNLNSLMKNRVNSSEIKLLVRCKLDGCQKTEQGGLLPVVIKPKIEYQLQYGATIATKSELSREWTSLFFRPYSNLYRARIHSQSHNVVTVEKCCLKKINSEAFTHYGYKPHLSLGTLQKVLEELMQLERGNYLLQHLPQHDGFVGILKECEESISDYDLSSEYSQCAVDREGQVPWIPIDVNYFLPMHNEMKRIPGLFEGFDEELKKVVKFGIVQRKFKKKKKKKKKVQKQVTNVL